MTIDERLERLLERHEALTQSVEMMSHQIAELFATAKKDGESIAALLATARQDGENIRALARIADIHERRLSALEGGDAEGIR